MHGVSYNGSLCCCDRNARLEVLGMIDKILVVDFHYDHPHEPEFNTYIVASMNMSKRLVNHLIGDEAIHAYAVVTGKSIDEVLREGGCQEEDNDDICPCLRETCSNIKICGGCDKWFNWRKSVKSAEYLKEGNR